MKIIIKGREDFSQFFTNFEAVCLAFGEIKSEEEKMALRDSVMSAIMDCSNNTQEASVEGINIHVKDWLNTIASHCHTTNKIIDDYMESFEYVKEQTKGENTEKENSAKSYRESLRPENFGEEPNVGEEVAKTAGFNKAIEENIEQGDRE